MKDKERMRDRQRREETEERKLNSMWDPRLDPGTEKGQGEEW